jgi:hypothetical protein
MRENQRLCTVLMADGCMSTTGGLWCKTDAGGIFLSLWGSNLKLVILSKLCDKISLTCDVNDCTVITLVPKNLASFAKSNSYRTFCASCLELRSFCTKPFISNLLQVTVKCMLCTEISPLVPNHIKEGPLSRRRSISTEINWIRPIHDRRQHQTWGSHTLIEMLIIALHESEDDFAAVFVLTLPWVVNFLSYTSPEKSCGVSHRLAGWHVTAGCETPRRFVY